MCVSLHRKQHYANRKSKSDSKSDKATNAILRSIQKLSYVFQNVEPLPEPTVGLTHVRRSILKTSDNRSPKGHLKLRYTKQQKMSTNIGNNWNHICALSRVVLHIVAANAPTFADRDPNDMLWAEVMVRKKNMVVGLTVVQNSRNVATKDTVSSPNTEWRVGYLSRPSTQTKDNLLWILVPPCTLGNRQSVSTSHDSDHGDWADRHNRGGHSLREGIGHVRHCPTSGRLSSRVASGKTLRRKWVFI